MGRAEEEAERARAARRAAIRREIAECRDKIRRLNEYKAKLDTEHKNSSGNVHVPSTNYDLKVSTDIEHWEGSLETQGDTGRNVSVTKIGTFLKGILSVIGTINSVIQRLEDRIDDLQRELASI